MSDTPSDDTPFEDDGAQRLDLSGKLLIALPGMPDPRFERSVILICAHSEDGAMGLMVNRPAAHVSRSDLMRQLSVEDTRPFDAMPIRSGGPVERERGFMLHTPDYISAASTLPVGRGFAMTATLDIFEDISEGRGPERYVMALGYCGWAPGQLEAELADTGWMVGDADPNLVFEPEDERTWDSAITAQGISLLSLSPVSGTA